MRARAALGVGLAAVMAVAGPAATYAGGSTPEPAGIDPATRADAVAAMHGHAYAYAACSAYAAQAGSPTVARLFRQTARQERYEHFAELARLTGLVRSDVDTLTEAIAGERHEATVMYPAFARQARRDGCTAAQENLRTAVAGERTEATATSPAYRDRAVRRGDAVAARLFDELARDEAKHAGRFTDALHGR
ncbi:ferritin family protein [Actinoplanes teichomyceticus]|uniref:Rubrerythrin n=1 Tax=Actinoplanes teichomyceticus TaxID=1867 RepID=A0A561VLU4_ACTTI|nr:ferritin family protein [Actinoplanes teichomyceticus]TWG12567.1 rubrerythrin [Actinoplanes teichomyceticus]GIF13934.1 hypothetical protein Ate01nite_39660 [Actinoplanes teichomyceticus]